MRQADGSDGFELKRGVFFARVDGEGILLDLPANRYIALDKSATAIWQHLASGTPLDAGAGSVTRQVESWKRAGLVVSRLGVPHSRWRRISSAMSSSQSSRRHSCGR